MIRRVGIAIGVTGAALLGGCADLMQRSTIAPEWFNAKAQEVKGTGYPELSGVPQTRGTTADQPQWEAAAKSLEAENAKIEQRIVDLKNVDKDLGDNGVRPTEEEIRAMAAQLRAKVEKDSKPRG